MMNADNCPEPLITVVVPAFNEVSNLAPLAGALAAAMPAGVRWELLVVDDGSTDGTPLEADRLTREGFPVARLSLSRNFGHQNALRAGLDHARGDAVITLDADLQHPPGLISEMLRQWRGGNRIVHAVREDSRDSRWAKRWTSRLFYRLLNFLSGLDLPPGSADFRLLDRQVVDVLKSMPEPNLFLRGMVHWVGFKSTSVSYTPAARHSGEAKYGIGRMMTLGLQGVTSFSIRPLRVATVVGFGFAGFAGFYAVYALVIFLTTNRALPGWTSVILSVLFCGGVQMMLMGMMGEYLGKLFQEAKRRPDYLVATSTYGDSVPSAGRKTVQL